MVKKKRNVLRNVSNTYRWYELYSKMFEVMDISNVCQCGGIKTKIY